MTVKALMPVRMVNLVAPLACLVLFKTARYTSPVSKEIGFGSPLNRCDVSRSLCTAESAASLFVPPVLAARTGSRKARRFAQAVPGLPTRSSCRQRLEAMAAVVANRTARRPKTMARIASRIAQTPTLSPGDRRAIERAGRILERMLKDPSLPRFDGPSAARMYLQTRLAPLDHEQAHALYLDSQHCLIAAEAHSIGTLTQAPVYPREIARAALRHNAAAVILAHNHPSGSATPSTVDRTLTTTVRAALEQLDVRLLDHVVVSGPLVVSAAEEGVL